MKIHFFPIITFFITTFGMQAQVIATYELTLEGAREIMAQAVEYAKTNNAPGGAIAIVDAGGSLILLERLTGTFPIAAEVSHGKARTAALFKMPSKNLEDNILKGRTSLITVGENMLRGGLPIIYKGKVIGGIGVSGAASADQDAEIAQAGLSAKFLQ
ncbi:MAG TPA: heme-binding protein [Saprospiraceae bacterium]|nr:heme-binding protein [Saprospiraceae bacterium]HMP24007.1 heme-binding protein [Saprospiraceae bacterium]